MSPSDRKKLSLAAVILVIAAIVIAWQFGLFGGRGAAPARPAEAPPPPNQPRVAPPGG